MANQIDEMDDEEGNEQNSPHNISKKKILLFLIPVLVVIAVAVGISYTFSGNGRNSSDTPYGIITKPNPDGKGAEMVTVFFDLPEVNVRLKNMQNSDDNIKIRVSLELSNIEDAKTIETLTPKLVDSIIAHTIELNTAEIEGASNLYWLKEELLYRINLITSPIKITNLNFKNFEVQNHANKGQQ